MFFCRRNLRLGHMASWPLLPSQWERAGRNLGSLRAGWVTVVRGLARASLPHCHMLENERDGGQPWPPVVVWSPTMPLTGPKVSLSFGDLRSGRCRGQETAAHQEEGSNLTIPRPKLVTCDALEEAIADLLGQGGRAQLSHGARKRGCQRIRV
jgi:hypothetical protein